MGTIDLKESLEKGTPTEYLVLESPFYKFRIALSLLEPLKERLEVLRDKFQETETEFLSVFHKGLVFKKPKPQQKNIHIEDVCFYEVYEAIKSKLIARMNYEVKPNQTQLK